MLPPIKLVSVNDPAISLEGDGLERHAEYVRNRDMDRLRTRAGSQPIVWTFRPLSRRGREFCELTDRLRVRWIRAFQMTFERVDGLDFKRFPWTPQFESVETGARALTESSMDALDECGMASFVNELGSVVYQRAYLDPFGGDSYVLPAGCTVNLERLLTATDPPSSDSLPTSPPTSPESGSG